MTTTGKTTSNEAIELKTIALAAAVSCGGWEVTGNCVLVNEGAALSVGSTVAAIVAVIGAVGVEVRAASTGFFADTGMDDA